MRLGIEEKGQALTRLLPRGLTAVGAGEPCKLLNMLLLRIDQPHSCWLDKLFFYLGGLLLVTLQINNLPFWAINTAMTVSAAISADTSGVPVHEQGSTEQASTNTSAHACTCTHSQIYSGSCTRSAIHTWTSMHVYTRTHDPAWNVYHKNIYISVQICIYTVIQKEVKHSTHKFAAALNILHI